MKHRTRKNRMPAALARYWASHRRTRKNKFSFKANPRHHKRESFALASNPRHRRHHRKNYLLNKTHKRYHRNPPNLKGVMKPILLATGGFVAPQYIRAKLAGSISALTQTNVYAQIGIDFGIGYGLSLLVEKFMGAPAAEQFLVGVGVNAGARLVNQFLPGTATLGYRVGGQALFTRTGAQLTGMGYRMPSAPNLTRTARL